MTIASKFFYHRRFHATRRGSDDPRPEDLGGRLAPRTRRSALENTDRFARRLGTPGSRRQLSHCVTGQAEPETVQLEPSKGEVTAGIRSECRHETSRLSGGRFRRDELTPQLPSSVLAARARLVERLQDFHFADSRGQVPSRMPTVHEPLSAERASINCSIHRKAGTAADLFGSRISRNVVVNNNLVDRAHWSRNMNDKTLSSHNGSLSCLKEEVFEDGIVGDNDTTVLTECSICIERFLNGEKLVRLKCGHRFHHPCLEPWLQAHEICPNCRASF